eukprot:366436-Chlamydomonas_euryale.AAC.31
MTALLLFGACNTSPRLVTAPYSIHAALPRLKSIHAALPRLKSVHAALPRLKSVHAALLRAQRCGPGKPAASNTQRHVYVQPRAALPCQGIPCVLQGRVPFQPRLLPGGLAG